MVGNHRNRSLKNHNIRIRFFEYFFPVIFVQIRNYRRGGKWSFQVFRHKLQRTCSLKIKVKGTYKLYNGHYTIARNPTKQTVAPHNSHLTANTCRKLITKHLPRLSVIYLTFYGHTKYICIFQFVFPPRGKHYIKPA